MNQLLNLINKGQSYWLDDLSREMIKNGALEKRVKEQGLRGMTSNPTIFNNAISNSDNYNDQIFELVNKNKSIHEIYEALIIQDVQNACDILRPVFDESDGVDGFVSLEVSPYLAHDTEESMREARRLFQAVDRPNLFIKIPGTLAGIPAIEQMLFEGININITLLFSIERYDQVAEAYIRALERRLDEGKSIDKIRSVASFFLSRIDVLVDQILNHYLNSSQSKTKSIKPELLFGQAGIASAKLAYQHFLKFFSNDNHRWKKLTKNGALVQRPLWASTSTKDPLYYDVKYIEPLIGRNTINTMPESTSAAFADHGIINEDSVLQNIDQAEKVVNDLSELGIHLDKIAWQLENEGVQKFIDPYNKLMDTISLKQQKYLEDKIGTLQFSMNNLEKEFSSTCRSIDNKQGVRRLFKKDPYLWTADSAEAKSIINRLGWLNSINLFINEVDEITNFVQEIKKDKIQNVVLLGMGGSSLSAEACRSIFGTIPDYPQLLVLDSTDPNTIKAIENQIDLNSTLFIVSSKSGATVETMSFYKYFYKKMKQELGAKAGKYFIAITDEGTPLAKKARQKEFRRIFINPNDIGGRYSVLSYFGLVPMALMGIDIRQILNNAQLFLSTVDPVIPSALNPAVNLGVLLGTAHQHGKNLVTFFISDSIRAFGSWVEQLLAESTGKQGKGLVPIVNEPFIAIESYDHDRIFVYLHTGEMKNSNMEKQLLALKQAGHPIIQIDIKDKMNIGAEFYRWEIATAIAGMIMRINPFNEPNVAESKENTAELLEEFETDGFFENGELKFERGNVAFFCKSDEKWCIMRSNDSINDFLSRFLEFEDHKNYITLLPFFQQTIERDKLLNQLRQKIQNRVKMATSIGYGPRYMHSTGQLHKGGSNNGVYIIMTIDPENEIAIPGEPYGFATLQIAQALGDLRSLENKGRQVIRIHLKGNVDQALTNLVEKIDF